MNSTSRPAVNGTAVIPVALASRRRRRSRVWVLKACTSGPIDGVRPQPQQPFCFRPRRLPAAALDRPGRPSTVPTTGRSLPYAGRPPVAATAVRSLPRPSVQLDVVVVVVSSLGWLRVRSPPPAIPSHRPPPAQVASRRSTRQRVARTGRCRYRAGVGVGVCVPAGVAPRVGSTSVGCPVGVVGGSVTAPSVGVGACYRLCYLLRMYPVPIATLTANATLPLRGRKTAAPRCMCVRGCV